MRLRNYLRVERADGGATELEEIFGSRAASPREFVVPHWDKRTTEVCRYAILG
jgi:hypothetical protein